MRTHHFQLPSITDRSQNARLAWLLAIVLAVTFSVLAAGASPVAQAQPAAPHSTYLVTSSSNAALTTCAGAPNDCSLRGAVQLANASGGADTINVDPSVTAISLNSPITLTGGSISLSGNGQEVTSLKTNGNFPALVIASSNNTVANFWINASGSHAGTAQHGIAINSGAGNLIYHNSLSDLGGDGVLIQGGSDTNVSNNTIGVRTVGGTQWAGCSWPNDQSGIRINGSGNNLIYGNTIGCNAIDGIGLSDVGATANELYNNYIGIVNWGGRVPNTLSGVAVLNGANHNLIGNSTTGNVIGASGGYGVYVSDSGTVHNTVQRNSIGVSGTLNISNTLDGVIVRVNATDNVVLSNIIADNAGYGVLAQNGADSTIIAFNVIGIETTSGGAQLAGCTFHNGQGGIRISGSSGNSVYNNTVGCSGLDGISVAGVAASSNALFDNHVGVTIWGGRVPNAQAGIAVLSGAHDNWIGLANVGNVIGANGTWGVYVGTAGTTTNTVIMNSIGIVGTTNISNTYDGVIVTAGAAANRVMSNTIAYNAGKGVVLTGAGTSRNVLQSNTIRLNGSAGVVIDGGATNNVIGPGGPRSAGNVISANAADGVYIGGATTVYNSVYGNYIGTNAAGNAADPNGQTGVVLDAGTSGNAIGSLSAERNVIAGNAWAGVAIVNGAHDNFVQFNDIGTNRDFPVSAAETLVPARPAGGGSSSYLHLPNGNDGVYIGGAFTNTIGGYAGGSPAPNFIHYNTWSGIYLLSGSHHNVIGLNNIQANSFYGVILDGGNTAYNTITRTLIYQNGLDGIAERNSAGFNVWTEVGVNDNGGLGIDKNAYNDGFNIVDTPNLFIDSINRTTGVVHGHADASVLGTVKIELYRVSPDPSGYGEGGVFLGSTTTDVSGNWTITDPSPLPVSGCYTALVTESQLVIPFTSSEFSANTCRTFLPFALKG